MAVPLLKQHIEYTKHFIVAILPGGLHMNNQHDVSLEHSLLGTNFGCCPPQPSNTTATGCYIWYSWNVFNNHIPSIILSSRWRTHNIYDLLALLKKCLVNIRPIDYAFVFPIYLDGSWLHFSSLSTFSLYRKCNLSTQYTMHMKTRKKLIYR